MHNGKRLFLVFGREGLEKGARRPSSREIELEPPTRRNRVAQFDVSEFETDAGGTWRMGGTVDYGANNALAYRVATIQTGGGHDRRARAAGDRGRLRLGDAFDRGGSLVQRESAPQEPSNPRRGARDERRDRAVVRIIESRAALSADVASVGQRLSPSSHRRSSTISAKQVQNRRTVMNVRRRSPRCFCGSGPVSSSNVWACPRYEQGRRTRCRPTTRPVGRRRKWQRFAPASRPGH